MLGVAARVLGTTSLKSIVRSALLGGLLPALVVALTAQTAFAQVLVIAAHPDDEALFASGIIYQAKQAGQNVKVVIMTNGDCDTHDIGLAREQESITAMTRLGLATSDVIFLGYPDCGLRDIYYYYTDVNSQFTSVAGFSATYGSLGLGNSDYHRYMYGVSARYNGVNMLTDLRTVLRNYRPQDIYLASAYDANPDHYITNLAVSESVLAQIKTDSSFQPTMHDAFVHEPCEDCDPTYHWPNPPFTPTVNFAAPPYLGVTPLAWSDSEQIDVPAIMQATTPATNLKSRAIADYVSQNGNINTSWLQAFVKHNEVFWRWEWWSNLALRATATASSNAGTGTTASRANDGAVVGFPVIPSILRGGPGEWVADQLAGAWVQLSWPTSQAITRVVLHDRPDQNENITGGTLTFSDGSSIPVGALPTNGIGLSITFAQKNVTSVRFTVTTATGTKAGLAEIEAYGPATTKQAWALPPANTPPTITNGPVPSPSSILDNATSTVSVTASDPNSDPLTYTWQVSGGQIQGSGSSVTFVPPTVISSTNFNVTVYVADGRGGIASASGIVIVSPSNGPSNIAGTATATASSQNTTTSQTAAKAIDGIVNGYPTDPQKEWATLGQLAGAWIQLTWSSPKTISKSVLHDRINLSDQILSGILRFSDGSTVNVGTLPDDGTGLTTNFAARTVTWVRFEVTSARGGSVGLAEWEVWSATTSGTNAPPQITSGPTANPTSITSAQSSTVSVTATDADGDALSYSWQATGGTVNGSGSTATFTPPFVSTTTTFRVDVFVADGRGGVANGFVNITVNPTPAGSNIALSAVATASAENTSRGQTAAKAIDGFVDGYPGDATREWVAPGQLGGAWIQLTWPVAQSVGRVVLHDRINTSDQILSGTLRFSDGSTIPVGTLPNDGVGQTFDFNAKSVTWVRLEVLTARGDNTGLAEFEVYPPTGFSNASPTISSGPTANPSTITDVQTTTVSVTASDPDGDPLTYQWSASGGTVVGTGASVTFTPPRITQNTTFTVTVIVGDGRGGSVTRSVSIPVTPSSTSPNRALASAANASSENTSRGQGAAKAIDGIVSGYPVDATTEWASVAQLAGAWIQLTWTSAQSITRVVLHDRINTEDQILGGTLTFSDGSSIATGALTNDGTGVTFNFAAKNVTWVRLTVTSARGGNTGLAEFEVY